MHPDQIPPLVREFERMARARDPVNHVRREGGGFACPPGLEVERIARPDDPDLALLRISGEPRLVFDQVAHDLSEDDSTPSFGYDRLRVVAVEVEHPGRIHVVLAKRG